MNKIDYIYDEYKSISEGSEHYFDYLYRIVSISIVFFTATIVCAFGSKNLYIQEIIFMYVLPVFTAVFGLIYCYNIDALAKIGYQLVDREKKLGEVSKEEFKEDIFQKGISYGKKFKKGYIVSYGPMLAIYIILPLVSMLVGWSTAWENRSWFQGFMLIDNNILNTIIWYIFPVIICIVYVSLMLIIIFEIKEIMKETNKMIFVDDAKKEIDEKNIKQEKNDKELVSIILKDGKK